MPDGLIIALSTIVGGFIGAFIKYVFDRRTTAENDRRVRKLQLYSSFIETFWEFAAAKGGKAAFDLSRLANEIALYGSEEVVRCLAPVIGRGYTQTTMTNLTIAMRRDILDEQGTDLFESVRALLFDRNENLPAPPVGQAE